MMVGLFRLVCMDGHRFVSDRMKLLSASLNKEVEVQLKNEDCSLVIRWEESRKYWELSGQSWTPEISVKNCLYLC